MNRSLQKCPFWTCKFVHFYLQICSKSTCKKQVTGEYEIDGYGFDTVIPETVDMQTVAQAAGTLMDEQQLSMPFQILTSVDAEQSFLKLWVVP